MSLPGSGRTLRRPGRINVFPWRPWMTWTTSELEGPAPAYVAVTTGVNVANSDHMVASEMVPGLGGVAEFPGNFLEENRTPRQWKNHCPGVVNSFVIQATSPGES